MVARSAASSAKKTFVISLHVGFFLIGMMTVLLGQILPVLSVQLNLNDRVAGYLFVAQFGGSLTGTFFYNRAIKKYGYQKMLLASFCLAAIGCAALNLDSLLLSASSIFLYGFGIGTAIPAVNLLIVELNREKSSSALNTVNFFWGLGAIFCKPFVDFAGSPNDFVLPTIALSVSIFLCGLAIAFSNFRENAPAENEISSLNATAPPIWTTKIAWLIAIFSLVQVGIESSVSGWITTYESRLIESPGDGWFSAAFVFFVFFVFGRGVAPLFFRFMRENAVMFFSLALMIAGTILILLAKRFSLLSAGAAILGFGAAAVFPISMSRLTENFGSDATKNAAPLFVLSALGSAFMTWLIGTISAASGDLRAGFSVVLIGCLILLVLQIILMKYSAKRLSR